MSSPVLKERQLLEQLPAQSRIVSPTGKVLVKLPDGVWWNRTNTGLTGAYLQPGHIIPAGSKAYLPHEHERPCYVKHSDGRWLAPSSSQPPAQNDAPRQPPPSQPAAGPSVGSLQIIPQTPYRRGAVPVDDCLVPFNFVPMAAAERGHVADPDMPAYSGELAVQEKATIRFGFPYQESAQEYTARQHNLQRYGQPIVRGQLAQAIAEELRRVLDALEGIDRPLTFNGRRLTFEDIYLVDIKRVSRGSLQPTLAARSA